MSRTLFSIALAASALALSSAPAAGHEPGPDTVAFVNAAVVPMDLERVMPDHTVVVAGGRITALGPAAEVLVPANAFRIDARGRTCCLRSATCTSTSRASRGTGF